MKKGFDLARDSHRPDGPLAEASSERLEALVSAELTEAVDPRVAAMGAAIAALYPSASRAVLFYGSCLREKALEGLMLDFYLIVSDYEAAYGPGWLARANRLLPPNVFPFAHEGLAAKYAVLDEADFKRLCGQGADNVSVWARFAQPSRLVWVADEAAQDEAIKAVAQAVPTLFALTLPIREGKDSEDVAEIWKAGFALTYGAELRAERKGKGGSIVDSEPTRYAAFGQAGLAELPKQGKLLSRGQAERRWRKLQRRGKWLSVARLAKASFTFSGGIDYLAWKINRHAGTQIAIKPWQRRWPILGAIILLPALLKRGAVR